MSITGDDHRRLPRAEFMQTKVVMDLSEYFFAEGDRPSFAEVSKLPIEFRSVGSGALALLDIFMPQGSQAMPGMRHVPANHARTLGP